MALQAEGLGDTSPAAAKAPTDGDLLQPWYMPECYFEELPGVLCATDLLVAWKPDTAVSPLSGTSVSAAWNTYFQGSAAAVVDEGNGSTSVSEGVQDVWDPGASAAAVECLFRFIHALEKQDMEEAMLCVAPDFHTFERDMDVDRAGLRLWLERRVDEWRGPELRISLTEIPDPIQHEMGILIHITLQVDHHNPFRDRMETLLLGYVVLLGAEPRGEMFLRGFCRVS